MTVATADDAAAAPVGTENPTRVNDLLRRNRQAAGDPGGALSAHEEDHIMEVAAFVLIGSIVLWFIEEATDRHP